MFDADKIEGVRQKLLKLKQTIATAESVTAGLLQVALASADDAIKFFQGGITTYNLGQKCRHLNIEPIHAQECNCVSESVAIEMAEAACKMFASNWGVSITGYASPVPESGNKVFAYFAIVCNGKCRVARKINGTGNNAMEVQMAYVNAMMAALLTQVKKTTTSK